MRRTLSLWSVICAAVLQGLASAGACAAEPRTVAIVIYEAVELLDFAGPLEVFDVASMFGSGESRAFEVYTVSPDGEPLTSQNILVCDPQHSFDTAPDPDIIVIPGGGARNLTQNPRFQSWLGEHAPQAELLVSVCNGARALAEAGMLDGISATTHWGILEYYIGSFPEVDWVRDVRFVDNGRIVTCAGISAGIDGSLHVVARLLGYEAARATARGMQYEWRPAESERSQYPRLNPDLDEAGRLKQLTRIATRMRSNPMLLEAITGLDELGLADAEALHTLAYSQHVTGDLDTAAANYQRAIEAGFDRAFVSWYNLACIRARQGETDGALDALERSIESGFTNFELLRTDAELESIRGEARFDKLLERAGRS